MSSFAGGHDEAAANEDVEADETSRTEAERAVQDPMEDDDDFGDYKDTQEGAEDFGDALEEGNGAEDSDNVGRRLDDGLLEQDVVQLEREEDEDIQDVEVLAQEPQDATPDAGPVTPRATSPLPSTADSGSIPDDTPSLQGSLLSSTGRGLSPSPLPSPSPLGSRSTSIGARRTVSRTASAALQPFERRFEARRAVSLGSSPRLSSPGFLSPHSRQVSLTSYLSRPSSQGTGTQDEDVPQAPWDVVRWTKLRNISKQAFSEAGKRQFGRPTCLSVSALIAIGTSKGLVLGFDYHQNLKIIVGQGTKATECGSVTALAIAADYSTIATGHANGYIFTWEINRPARPFLQIPPLDRSALEQQQHPDGHVSGGAILHIGFLGTRHTALVSADAGGMAFSHLATRGLGPVTRSVKSTRLLGRYPAADPKVQNNRKASSVLAFSPLPLGNIEQATDGMGLTALLTPYLLVIVSTTPIAQTQFKSPRPKEIKPHSTLSGCLAWFPTVKLKAANVENDKTSSQTKLAYCWSNVLTVLDVATTENEDTRKPPGVTFTPRSRWRAEEPIVAVQWLGRSVLAALTISQRMLILEDVSLQVTDTIDLLHRHVYHQDLFSQQLHAVVENSESEEPSLHGVVADAFYMSYKTYKGRVFLLGFNDLTVGTLSNWADRLMALMEAGDHIAAIRLATEYYAGGAHNVAIGLPEQETTRHEMVRERLIAMLSASLSYTFSQKDDDKEARLRELAEVCFEACISMQETPYLFSEVFEAYGDNDESAIFIACLEPYILDGEIKSLPAEVVKSIVSHFISENEGTRLEELLCRLDPLSFDLDQITTLCRQHSLYDALIYVWAQGLGDPVTPLIDLMSLVKMLQEGDETEDLTEHPFFESAAKVFPYLAYSFTGRRYPSGELMADNEASKVKAELYEYVFTGTPTAWPPGSKKVFRTVDNPEDEPAFPYLVLLLSFDAPSFMSMLNEAFEDSFLNDSEDESGMDGAQVNGAASRPGYRMTRQHIVSIMLDVMRQHEFDAKEVIYLDMFIARSLPKYPGQLVLSGTLLTQVLQRLCRPPSDDLRADCQLSVEYLLSAYRPPDVSALVQSLREIQFYRVLKSVYRTERMFVDLLETYFEDPDDRYSVFDCIALCLRPSTAASEKQVQAIKKAIIQHANDLADVDVIQLARSLATYAKDLLQPVVEQIQRSETQFTLLRTLLEPDQLRDSDQRQSAPLLAGDEAAEFVEEYVKLLCLHDPGHVADYVSILPSSNLRMDQVLPAMEEAGVIDAAIILLGKDGRVRDAVDRLVAHLQSLSQALSSLIVAIHESPDAESSLEAAEDLVAAVEKYTKVGIWLCQGQSAIAERRPRPRTNFSWDISEDDLDVDEYLWLNLVDATVQVSRKTTLSVENQERNAPFGETPVSLGKVTAPLRANVQQIFTALLAATAPTTKHSPQSDPRRQQPARDNLSFLRVLRAFLTRAATTAPSLSDLRAVLSDIFAAYTFEQGVLSLANELLGSDVFTDISKAYDLRLQGWRPRSQVCDGCKRRAWGQGMGEVVWDEWVLKEQHREAEKARKLVERGGGEEARKLERGKAKATATVSSQHSEIQGEDAKKLALVVFACRHAFHRSCLDPECGEGRGSLAEGYKCPLCKSDR